ncbi:lipase [Cantharellus anzutake]|uniref:lipase n=1 Tax=Cantharellus anzutake TaxID=1750568 RepID=UPI0019052465|nr:lipase [Cantharellus anzutake]KAF8332639.1 lipase [Cantharellus anzutake]
MFGTSILLAFGASILRTGANPILAPRSTSATPMTSSEELDFAVPAQFASAAYCDPVKVSTWSCGSNCDALPDVKIYATGGDGSSIQYWYVGYDGWNLGAIVVGHQGTNLSSLAAGLTDVELFLEPLNSTLFPGLSSSIMVHSGFSNAHSRSARDVLAGVQAAMADTGCKNVWMVGHSLGGAIALLDSVYLPVHLPSNTTFYTNTFGMPRVGNQDFADYVDANVKNFARVTNKLDPISIVPGQFLGFHHPSCERHIVTSGTADGDWYNCDGQDNTSKNCSVGAVGDILDGSISDHSGPYGPVRIGC